MHSMVGEELNFIPGSNLFGNEIWEGKPHFTETQKQENNFSEPTELDDQISCLLDTLCKSIQKVA